MRADTKEQRETTERLEGERGLGGAMRADTKEQREDGETGGVEGEVRDPGGHPRHAGKDGKAQRKTGERRERERDRERREGTERQAKSQTQGVSERKSREVETELPGEGWERERGGQTDGRELWADALSLRVRRARPGGPGVPEIETGEMGVGGETWLRALGAAGEESSVSQPPFPSTLPPPP